MTGSNEAKSAKAETQTRPGTSGGEPAPKPEPEAAALVLAGRASPSRGLVLPKDVALTTMRRSRRDDGLVDPGARQAVFSLIPEIKVRAGDAQAAQADLTKFVNLAMRAGGKLSLHPVGGEGQKGLSGAPVMLVRGPQRRLLGVAKVFPNNPGEFVAELSSLDRLASIRPDLSHLWSHALTEATPVAPVVVAGRVLALDGDRLRVFDARSGVEHPTVDLSPSSERGGERANETIFQALDPEKAIVVRGRDASIYDAGTGKTSRFTLPVDVRTPGTVFSSAQGPALFMTAKRVSPELGRNERHALAVSAEGAVLFRTTLPEVPRAIHGGPSGVWVGFGPDVERVDTYGAFVPFGDAMRLIHLDGSGKKASDLRLPGVPSSIQATPSGEVFVGAGGELLALPRLS